MGVIHALKGDTAYEPTDDEWRLLDRLHRSPTDREAMSAAHVLGRIAFARVAGAIGRYGIHFGELLDTPWSSGERVLIGVAAALWTGNDGIPMADVVTSLDDGNLRAVLEAILLWRGWWVADAAAPAAVGAQR